MREIRTSGSVGAWGGKPPGLPDPFQSELWGQVGARICRQASMGEGFEAKLPACRPDGGCFWRAGQKQSTPWALQGVRRPPTDPIRRGPGYRTRRSWRHPGPDGQVDHQVAIVALGQLFGQRMGQHFGSTVDTGWTNPGFARVRDRHMQIAVGTVEQRQSITQGADGYARRPQQNQPDPSRSPPQLI